MTNQTNKKLNTSVKPKTAPIIVISFLALILVGSLIAMWLINQNSKGALVAYIYQDGELIKEIPLDLVTESYTIEVRDGTILTGSAAAGQHNVPSSNTSDAGTYNLIEVRSGSIGMIDANCPDKLCVHMGFQDSAMVPITCLPNKVVIQLRIEGENKLDGISH